MFIYVVLAESPGEEPNSPEGTTGAAYTALTGRLREGPTHLKRLWVSPIEASPVTSCGNLEANSSQREPLRSPLRTDLTFPNFGEPCEEIPLRYTQLLRTHTKVYRTQMANSFIKTLLELACTLKSVSLVSQEDLRVTSSRIPNTSGQPKQAPSLPNWKEQKAGYLLSGIWHSRQSPSLRGHHCHEVGLLLPWEREEVGLLFPFPDHWPGVPLFLSCKPWSKDSKSEK